MQRVMAIMAVLCGCAAATPLFTIDNPDIIAVPGGTAYWDFHLYNDGPADFLVVDSASFQQMTPVGMFNDIISTAFHMVGPQETWSGVFGSYTVSTGAVAPASSAGRMTILYDVLDGDFNTVSSGNSLDSVETASITVGTGPEPAPVGLMALGVGALLAFRRRLRA